ncbi:pyridoxal-phosphate dependent enzyme family protein [Mycobacterium xenopi 3993]|nr:pyridoxal-phosphate dependent enzyme family protein [Mycobacterium xenopi 3993]
MSAELSQEPSAPPLSAADIDAAAKRIAPVVAPTPLQLCERLSEATGATVYLKREDLQSVRSYKLRGAYNLLVQLSEDEIAAGVVCSSAGNHAQGFAYACRALGFAAGSTCRPRRLSRRRTGFATTAENSSS